MHNEGSLYAEVENMMHRSRFTIRSIIKRFKGASTDQENVKMVQKVKKDPRIASTPIARKSQRRVWKGCAPDDSQKSVSFRGVPSQLKLLIISRDNIGIINVFHNFSPACI